MSSVQLLYRGVQLLEPKRQISVILHDLGGRTPDEIADFLGFSVQDVVAQIKTGRAELSIWFAELTQGSVHDTRDEALEKEVSWS